MVNYVKSELYRLARKRGAHYLLAACVLAPILITLVTAGNGGDMYANTEFPFKFAMHSWSLLFFIIPLIVSLVVADDFMDGTLKNTVAYGVSRRTIFYGKWLVSLLLLVISWIVTYVVLTACVFMLLSNNGSSNFTAFTSSIMGILPLSLAALTVSHCLFYLLEKVTPHFVSYVVIMIIVPELYYFLSRSVASLEELVNRVPLFPYAAANDFVWLKPNGTLLCWIVGTAYVLVAFLLSSRSVERKEFK